MAFGESLLFGRYVLCLTKLLPVFCLWVCSNSALEIPVARGTASSCTRFQGWTGSCLLCIAELIT